MMQKTTGKPKYERPGHRTLGGLSAAEGFCSNGGTASLTTCATGGQTYYCSSGDTPSDASRPQLCFLGAIAANCMDGTDAGG